MVELARKGDVRKPFNVDLRFIADRASPISQFALCARVQGQTKQFLQVRELAFFLFICRGCKYLLNFIQSAPRRRRRPMRQSARCEMFGKSFFKLRAQLFYEGVIVCR